MGVCKVKLRELISKVNDISPFFLQESYDNSGLQFGDLDSDVKKILLALEITSDSVNEALKVRANVILSHHPILFFAVKKISKQDMPALFSAFVNNINLVSAHTNFDLAANGLNDFVGKLLGIKKDRAIVPSSEKTYKLAVYVPIDYTDQVREALFNAGAGQLGNYKDSSFNVSGKTTFTPLEGTKPFLGKTGERSIVNEVKIETIVRGSLLDKVISSLKEAHPYEEPAYDLYELKIDNTKNGIGMVGSLENSLSIEDFALIVKKKLKAKYVRLIGNSNINVKRIALCTGAGSSLLDRVKRLNVDLFITGDITYHTAIHAKEIGLNILDVEHFDSEKFFVDAMYKSLIQKGVDRNLLAKYNNELSPYKLIK
jgi:dinuclear metal center YbgI/SA1388 family protein